MPDTEYLKELVTRIEAKNEAKAEDVNTMSILEKTKHFLAKKAKKIEEAEAIKEKDLLKGCTFKPDLSKPKISHSKPSYFSNQSAEISEIV